MASKLFASRLQIRASVLAMIVSALAFSLRVYRLADKNIWWDEGWSIWLSKQDFAAIALRTAADEHPPLHYWMLKVWSAFFGSSAYAGRFLSVAFGVLTIALIYRIGKHVGGSWVSVLAAFILAISRFHLWWSQDIKNYTSSIFFAFAAVWFGLRLIAGGEWQIVDGKMLRNRYLLYVIGYSLSAALAMFTHYLAALVLLALNLYIFAFLAFHASRNKTRLPAIRNWLFANLLAAALFTPWLYLYLQNAQSWVAAPTFDFTQFLKLVATVLPLGVTTNIDDYFPLTIIFTIFVALGCIPVNSKSSLFNVHFFLFTVIVLFPPVLLYILSLTPAAIFAPKIQARYLVVLAPAYAMLLALGIALVLRRSRAFAAVAFLFLIASSAFVLRDYFAERRLTDDYATLANTINAFARQGDLVLLDTDQEWPTFLNYMRAPLDWLGVPNGVPMTDPNADSINERVLARHRAVWIVTIPDALATDPQKVVETRLAREWKKQFEKSFGDKRLALYAPDLRDLTKVAPENFAPQHRMNGSDFLGFDLPIREARPGDTVRLATYWYAPRGSQAGITLGQISVTERIGLGERVRVQSDFILPPTASGELPLTVNQIEIARIHVEPRGGIAPVGRISRPTTFRFDAIDLVGYDLPITNFRSGDQVPITIYWRAEHTVNKNYIVFVHLLGTEFNATQNNFLWGQIDRAPTLPVPAWQPNLVVSDPYRVPVALNAPVGVYKIEVGMYDAVTGARLPVNSNSDSIILAEVQIVAR